MALGHQEMAYAVHTNTCTYLLDESGVCRWIVSQQGVVPAHVRQCIGAQFVACLDLGARGGLVGELRRGAQALFVRSSEERMVLLRTGTIRHVDDRRENAEYTRRGRAHSEPPPPEIPAPVAPRSPRRDREARMETQWSQPIIIPASPGQGAHVGEGPTPSTLVADPGAPVAEPFPYAQPEAHVPRQYGKQGGLPYRAKPPRFGIVRRTGEEQTITVNRMPASGPTGGGADPMYGEADTLRRDRK